MVQKLGARQSTVCLVIQAHDYPTAPASRLYLLYYGVWTANPLLEVGMIYAKVDIHIFIFGDGNG